MMRKLLTIILLSIFAAAYVPAISSLLQVDALCLAEAGEDGPLKKSPETQKEKSKKDLSEFLQPLPAVPLNAAGKFSFCHGSHFWGSNPAADVLTPPPNWA
jgi:hypothetical protein